MANLAWFRQVLMSLALALVAGALVYLVVRGITGAWLFFQQQQLLRDVISAVQSGLDAPPSADLRAIRREIAALDERNAWLSLSAASVAAAVAAACGYVWLEQKNHAQ